MKSGKSVRAEEVRRVRRGLDETQAQFAKRLDVDPVTVARWETGQRRCTGLYAMAVARLDPEGRLSIGSNADAGGLAHRDEARFSALAHLIRAFFDGSTAKAVSALVARETLSSEDLDSLATLIDKKRGKRRKA
jgi:transcriptional regulator with XRE-family HTH domain